MLVALFLVITSMGFAYFGSVVVTLVTMPTREMRVMSGSNRVFCCEMPLCFSVMARSFFVMVRGVVMIVSSWMFTGHD